MNDGPGPAGYAPDMSVVCKRAPGFSFRKKTQLTNTITVPGPGAYKPSVTAIKGKTASHKISHRFDDPAAKEVTPGPGQYDLMRKSQSQGGLRPGRTFGMPRPQDRKSAGTPGPMAYRITNDDLSRKPSYSMRLKLEKPPGAAGTNTPGPGNYNLGTTSMTYQAASATRKGVKMLSRPEHRVDAVSGAQLVGTTMAIPGPGAYDMDKDAMAKTNATPAWTMSTKTPHNMNGEIVSPGPAAYLPKDNYLPKKQARSMGMKYIKNTEGGGPGPMSYKPQYGRLSRSQSQPSVTMALRHTDAASRENTPGPGAYSGYRKSRRPAHTMAGRWGNASKRTATPSPYDTRRAITYTRKRSAAFSMAGTYMKSSALDAGPGPGAYDLSDKRWGKGGNKGAILGTRRLLKDERSITPGPGAYDTSSLGSTSPAFTMPGKNDRMTQSAATLR